MKQLSSIAVLSLIVFISNAQSSEIFAPNQKAIHGYDPVAFFTVSQAVKGHDSLTYEYKGVRWFFASRKNAELFRAMPEKYLPQFGGYCAYGAAQGHKSPTETDTWTVVDGKLYFNYNQKVKSMWVKDQPALIQKAHANWPNLKDK